VQQARSERDSLQIDELQLLDSVAVETREAIDRINVAIELVRALEGTVAQAQSCSSWLKRFRIRRQDPPRSR